MNLLKQRDGQRPGRVVKMAAGEPLEERLAQPDRRRPDAGSVTPLVLGMTLCLLLLSAGVIAAGSAFLGGQKLQGRCDGAAAVAANASPMAISNSAYGAEETATAATQEYLAIRGGGVGIALSVQQGVVLAQCSARVPITFGAVFGTPTLQRTVQSVGQPRYTGSQG